MMTYANPYRIVGFTSIEKDTISTKLDAPKFYGWWAIW